MTTEFFKRGLLTALAFTALGPCLNAQVVPLTKVMTVNIIEVGNGSGYTAVGTTYAANLAAYEQATQRIFAQVGVRIVWGTPSIFVDAAHFTVSDVTDLGNLSADYEVANGTLNINLLYVFFTGNNGGTLGVDPQSINIPLFSSPAPYIQNYAAVSESIFGTTYKSLDVIGHELGHSLGLTHFLPGTTALPNSTNYYYDFAVTQSSPEPIANLMYANNAGVTTIGQITSNGTTGKSIISPNQLALMSLSPLITPSPGYQFDYSTNTVSAAASDFPSWQQSKFTAGELLDGNISGPNAVYGLDGFPNLAKYALGLEPKQNITTGLPSVSTTGSDWVYTYTRPSSVADVTYSVEVSTDLSTWTTVGVTHEFVSTSGGIDTWRGRYALASAANVYFRLKVTR